MLNTRAIALQGIGFSLHPIMLAVLGLLPEEEQPIDPLPLPTGGGSSAPWRWVTYAPVKPRRPKKRRDAELLFL